MARKSPEEVETAYNLLLVILYIPLVPLPILLLPRLLLLLLLPTPLIILPLLLRIPPPPCHPRVIPFPPSFQPPSLSLPLPFPLFSAPSSSASSPSCPPPDPRARTGIARVESKYDVKIRRGARSARGHRDREGWEQDRTMLRSAEGHDPRAGTGIVRVGSKMGKC